MAVLQTTSSAFGRSASIDMMTAARNDMAGESRRRRRPAKSCLECRRRKVKCNRNDPCNHCTFSKRICVYNPYAPGPDVAQQTGTSPSRSTVTNDTTPDTTSSGQNQPTAHECCAAKPHAPTQKPWAVLTGDGKSLVQDRSPTSNNDLNIDDLNRRVKLLENLLSTRSVGPNTGPNDELPESVLQDGRTFVMKTRIFGQSHWITTAQEFKLTKFMRFCSRKGHDPDTDTEEERAWKAEIRGLLQKCKQVAKASKAARPSRCFSCPEASLSPPVRDFADLMTHLYITRFESAFRILHIPSFLAEYEDYWKNPEGAPAVLRLKIQLVLACGSSLHRNDQNEAEIRSMARQWIYGAQSWLSGPLEKDRLTISGLQVQCLLVLARQNLSFGGDLLWISMGSVVRVAIQMGFHRDPKHFSGMSILFAEIRRRLWATILEMSIQSSLNSGMPSLVSFDDFDTEPPSNNDDVDIDWNTKTLQPQPKTKPTDVSLQLLLLKSLRPRLQVIHCRNGLGGEISYDEVVSLSSEISNACRECSLSVKNTEDPSVVVFRRNMAEFFLRRFMLPLHRPFASRALQNPLFYFSRKACLDSAMAIILPERNEDFAHFMLVDGAIVKECIRFASLVLSLELLTEVDEDLSRNNAAPQRHTKYRDMLIGAVKDAMSLAAKRLQHGETSVKLHMFLSMVVAQAESSEVDISVEESIARSSKRSLESSLQSLQNYAGSSTSWSLSSETDMTFSNTGEEALAIDFQLDDLLQDPDIIGASYDSCQTFYS